MSNLIQKINNTYVHPFLSIWFVLTLFAAVILWLTELFWLGITSLGIAKTFLFGYIYTTFKTFNH